MIETLTVLLADDAVLSAIDEAVFGAIDVPGLDPATYQVNGVEKVLDGTEVKIRVSVGPKPA